jgi:diaminopimelate decarboxylase
MILENSGIDMEMLAKLPTPCYVYSERLIEEAYDKLASMESAYGMEIRYAMKANSSAAVLKILK